MSEFQPSSPAPADAPADTPAAATSGGTLAAPPSAVIVPSPDQVGRATRATMALFFVNGATFATWGVHIPTIKARFALTDAVLSLAMLAVAVGAILAMGPVGRWVAGVGSARASRLGGLAFALMTIVILTMPSFLLLVPALLVFGMSNAAFDVAMNAQAATVEASRVRPVMSAQHGMFSLGGMAGAGVGGVMIALGVPVLAHAAAMAAGTALTALYVSRQLLPDHPAPADAAHHREHATRALWLLGFLAFLGLVGEGAMYDWTTVYMREVAAAPDGWISLGYAMFSAGMAIGRFTGDRIRARWSDGPTLTASAWTAFAGITLAIAWPEPFPTLAGFTLMGLGAANMVPILFVAASRLPGMAAAEAIAGVSRFAYVGLLLGPVMIGGVAQGLGQARGSPWWRSPWAGSRWPAPAWRAASWWRACRLRRLRRRDVRHATAGRDPGALHRHGRGRRRARLRPARLAPACPCQCPCPCRRTRMYPLPARRR